MKLKTSGVTAWSGTGDQLPAGSYVIKVVQAEEGNSRAGNPQVILDLQVADGDFAGAEIRDWVTITENAMGRVVQILQALGYDTDKDVDLNVTELVDKRAEIVVREDTWTGTNKETGDPEQKTGMKVKGYRPVPVNRASDVPADAAEFTNGNGNGSKKNDDLPF